MAGGDWSREEVQVIVEDYLSMLASEYAGTPYSKAAHRRALLPRLNGRSEQSIEFKHMNISAVLLDCGFPYIGGYKPRSNYQALLYEIVIERLAGERALFALAEADADAPMVVPEVEDPLAILHAPPRIERSPDGVREPLHHRIRLPTNYIEREARNRSLGSAGELFIIHYEQQRLVRAGKEGLASRIEHTAVVRGDHEGYDILSFEEDGRERLIEVKTTKYGQSTPFYVTRNEAEVSARNPEHYHVYRLHTFRKRPGLYTLPGAIYASCELSAVSFLAWPRAGQDLPYSRHE
jgi:hypothetical protein